jgi:hypothetical protein
MIFRKVCSFGVAGDVGRRPESKGYEIMEPSICCPSAFGQKARHVLVPALKKWDIPKFKAFSIKKGLKNGVIWILSKALFKKAGLSHKNCADAQPNIQ